ncbi:zinc finger protein 32-like [Sabethes cyaneus]|uniref:zinc finger protein 32-like n=1 Tax=Sabethes cyaneus TaxID=53552 RepID=UPI00237DCFB6|nr:zinc finger protein 32-like [Sabethes cyaneus]
MEKTKSAHHYEGYPFPGKYTVLFKYFKFDPKLRTTKRQTDIPLVIVNPNPVTKETTPEDASSDRSDNFEERSEQSAGQREDDKGQNKQKYPPKTPCPTCGKVVKDLKSHMLVHTGSKDFPCSFCGKKFTYKSDRVLHENIHKGLKPYKCTECPSAFAHRKSLLTHKVTHTKSRNYRCKICGKTYGHLILLNKHLAAHKDDRRFKCFVCERTFLAKQVLQKHMLIHSNARPHACHLCSKQFRRLDQLNAHLKIHERESDQQKLDEHGTKEHRIVVADEDTVFVDIDQTDSQPGSRALSIPEYYPPRPELDPLQTPEVFGSTNQPSYAAEDSYGDHLNRLVGGDNYSLPWDGDGYQF